MRWRAGVVFVAGLSGIVAVHDDCGAANNQCLIGQFGDLGLDGDVDLDDGMLWEACRSGPGIPVSAVCCHADLDGDGDADQTDFGLLQAAHTGSYPCPADATPQAFFICGPPHGQAPRTVTFDAARTGDPTACYRWDFGDGTWDSGQQTAHTYTTVGNFTVKLAVTSAAGLVGTAQSVVSTSDGSFDLNAPVTANEARRFLWQAAFGPLPEDVAFIMANGYEAWINAQVALPPTLMLVEDLNESADKGYGWHPDTLWDDVCIEAPDQLRQRMAWALLQILVMNNPQDTAGPDMEYYSQYIQHALGNYRDLLGYVTYSHQMGVYLTYINNIRADPDTGTVPDENYAREVMQLFTIGLWLLNPDGTRLLDPQGNPIPTYDNTTIQQFARIFTGFRWSDFSAPMPMQANRHEFGDKQLLVYPGVIPAGGFIPAITLPGSQTVEAALSDVEAALDHLFYHPNCAPFVSELLIKRLVTSNPTPAYVGRVAAAFEGHGPYGSGVRGDLFATAKAILLDPEARDPAYRSNPYYGKVMEPLVARWGLYRIMERVDRAAEVFPFRIASATYELQLDLGQAFMQSPSVFNFYLPDYIPPRTELSAAERYAPELQIYNDFTAMATQNRFHQELVIEDGAQESARYDDWRALANDSAALVAALNDELMFGTLNPDAAQIIVNALNAITGDTDRVRTAVWLIVNSPEFRVLK
ncbi:MAG: hypothetical protein AMXMBFR13_33220 [Phycisphaerae bacterium]